MAMFIARVGRGRSIRAIVIMLSIVAPIVTNFWFIIVCGTGIAFELSAPNSVSAAFEGFNLPAALLAVTQNLPLGFLVSLLFLILTTIFVATTGDSMTYVISVAMSREDRSSTGVRVFWGMAMGVMALILVSTGAGGVGKLQSFIVVTAVPVVAGAAAVPLRGGAYHVGEGQGISISEQNGRCVPAILAW